MSLGLKVNVGHVLGLEHDLGVGVNPSYKPCWDHITKLPNSISYTEEGNLSKPRRMSHHLAHSTGLPKPPSYNLERPRVTPIQVTLVTGPLAKHRLMTSIQSGAGILLTIQLYTQNCLATSRVARRNLDPDRLADTLCC